LLQFDGGLAGSGAISNQWAVLSAPGADGVSETRFGLKWDEVVVEVRKWLRRIREDSGPDLWALAAEQRGLLRSGEGLPNTPFAPEEKAQLFGSLDQLLKEVKETQHLSAAQAAGLEKAVVGAKEAAGRMGRKDWVLLFYGSMVTFVITAAFAPDQARHLFDAAVHAIQSIVHTVPLLPP